MSEVMEPMDSAQPVRRPAPEDVPKFGKGTPMGRPGQPNEVRPGVPVPGVREHDLQLANGSDRRGNFSQLPVATTSIYESRAALPLKNNAIFELARSLH